LKKVVLKDRKGNIIGYGEMADDNTYICDLAFERSKVLDWLESYSWTWATHILKCFLLPIQLILGLTN
jgi:hypothetical protein